LLGFVALCPQQVEESNTFAIVPLALAACAGDGDAKEEEPPSASKSAADLRMLDQREVEIEGLNWAQDDTIFVATSPSGGLLVSLGTE
jgi:hypothetical protein